MLQFPFKDERETQSSIHMFALGHGTNTSDLKLLLKQANQHTVWLWSTTKTEEYTGNQILVCLLLNSIQNSALELISNNRSVRKFAWSILEHHT